MTYPFLSDEWMSAAKDIRAKYADQASKVTTVIRMNQVITDVPFGDGTVKSYLDTSSGDVVMMPLRFSLMCAKAYSLRTSE